MNKELAIQVTNLSKAYKLYDNPVDRLKESLHPFRKKYHRDFYALKDVSFEVNKGESVGIIGSNGSGKSTLLKIITGVLTPTEGSALVDGNVSALLELGTGFNPELTGIENIYFNGTLKGITRSEMDARIDDILAFADIGDFAHQPIKTYSSGMLVRLAFSAAINIVPSILIVDEALSVGDIFFQQKSFARMRNIISSGTTCLFVSHSMAAIQNLCSRAVLLKDGEIDFIGESQAAVSRYLTSVGKRRESSKVFRRPSKTSEVESEKTMLSSQDIIANNILVNAKYRHGGREMEIVAACVQDMKGMFTFQAKMMETLTFHLLLRTHEPIDDPSAGLVLIDRLGNTVFACGSRNLKHNLPELQTGQEIIVRFDLRLTISQGEYTFHLGCSIRASEEDGPDVGFNLDRHEMLGPIVVTANFEEQKPFYGMAQLPLAIKSYVVSKELPAIG